VTEKSKGYSKVYHSETEKIRPKISYYLQKANKILDIGCGNDKITKDAIGIDGRNLPTVDHVLENNDDILDLNKFFLKNYFNLIYSSHCLEHLQDDMKALKNWASLIKEGGHLILYLPDDRYYNNDSNPEHLQRYTFESFMEKFAKANIESLKFKEGFMDIGHDLYSFCIIFEKVFTIEN